ncbi:MAG: hypothetical protein ACREJ5_22560 [Geminicoccaceae bacterium]
MLLLMVLVPETVLWLPPRFGDEGWSSIRMDEIAGGDLVRITLLSSSEIEQFLPGELKMSRSAAGPPHRGLLVS